MWIQFNNAFLSIVENRDNKLELLVRARVKGDIEKIFLMLMFLKMIVQIINLGHLFQKPVAAKMMFKMTDINYDNFKNSVKEIERKNAYNVWIELRKLQK